MSYVQVLRISDGRNTGEINSEWLHRFKVPEQFSVSTMEALEAGKVTAAIRNEIVTAPAVQVMQHTMHPTSQVQALFLCNYLSQIHSVYLDIFSSIKGVHSSLFKAC